MYVDVSNAYVSNVLRSLSAKVVEANHVVLYAEIQTPKALEGYGIKSKFLICYSATHNASFSHKESSILQILVSFL